MKSSPAKKEFKKRFGQANHLLITTLVGLDGIYSGKITEKPEDFSTSWNPKDAKSSADRARVFVLKSFLGSAVESLEMYLTTLNRKPKLLESEKFTELYSKAGQSIYKKTTYVADEIQVDPILIGLMEVLITWRNYEFHYDVDNEIRGASLAYLREHSDELKKRFSGLEIEELKKTWETKGDFTFKETASLIRATQDFVSEIDLYVIEKLNSIRYYSELIIRHFEILPNSKIRFISYDSERRRKFVLVLLQNIAGETEIEESVIDKIINNIQMTQ